MLLVTIISVMYLVALLGRSTRRMSAKSYLLILLLSLIQVGLVFFYVYTKERPPLM